MTTDKEMAAHTAEATRGPWTWKYAAPFSARLTLEAPAGTILNSGSTSDADNLFISAARDWVPQASSRFDELRRLHKKVEFEDDPGNYYCEHCWLYAADEHKPYPCPTMQIVDEHENVAPWLAGWTSRCG